MSGTIAIVALMLILSACGTEPTDSQESAASFQGSVVPDSMTIPRMLETDDRFSTLRAALDSMGLDSLLATDGPYTLFAPPNTAFDALPPGTMETLLSEQPDRLRTILAKHVVEGRVSTPGQSLPQTVVAMSGDTLTLAKTREGVSVGGVAIVDGNIKASNGLLHVVDEVLPPPSEPSTP